MKKIVLVMALAFIFAGVPAYSAPGGHGPGGHGAPSGARPAMGGRPPMHSGVSVGHRPNINRPPIHSSMHRPPHHIGGGRPLPPPPPIYRRPYRPIITPYYYSSLYYPTTYTTYTYYPYDYSYQTVEAIPAGTQTVIVRDNYAGVNTAANVINAAANVAATIRYLTW